MVFPVENIHGFTQGKLLNPVKVHHPGSRQAHHAG
jgi:hypothetical protein